jgi:hypothetical protein
VKLEQIILGRAIRIIRINSRPLYMLDAIKPLVDQYKFLKVPQTLEEYDGTKGITFRHGKFNANGRDIVIDSFQVFNNGLLVDTREDTEDADRFIDDVIGWGVKTFGFVVPEQSVERVYLSNLEISLIKPLSTYIPIAQQLSGDISHHLTEYGLKHEPFETVVFTLNFDRTGLPNSFLTNFTLQRLDGAPFSSGLYFSSAPLKTKDHIALLQKMDS